MAKSSPKWRVPIHYLLDQIGFGDLKNISEEEKAEFKRKLNLLYEEETAKEARAEFESTITDPKKTISHQELIEKVTEHLEYLGFDIGPTEDSKDGNQTRLLATHKNRSNITFTFVRDGIITAYSSYIIDPLKIDKKRLKAMLMINQMNLKGVIMSFCIPDNKDRLICSSWYPHEYSKKNFADFLENYEKEIQRRLDDCGLKDFNRTTND